MWVRKPTGQCWVSLSRWHLQQSQWQKPVICLVICSSRIFWGRWLRIEIAKAFISLCWFQQEPALSESKLALYQKVLCLLGTYFYHLTLVFKEWFLSLSPFTFLLCSWNLLCLIPEDKGDIKQGGNSSGGGGSVSELLLQEFDGDDSLNHNYNHTNVDVMAGKHAQTHSPTNSCDLPGMSSEVMKPVTSRSQVTFSRRRKEPFFLK